MRNTGPKMRQVRRFGEDFALSADRSLSLKFPKLQRKQPPGQHGVKRQFKKVSSFGTQLLEKQKIKFYYHISERQLHKYYVTASGKKGSTSANLMKLLETRLDNVVYRAGFADSHPAARHLVSHAHFAVNGKKVDVPSYQLKAGDVVEVRTKSAALREQFKEMLAKNEPVAWLRVDGAALTAEVITLPERDQIDTPVLEQMVIEFYSR